MSDGEEDNLSGEWQQLNVVDESENVGQQIADERIVSSEWEVIPANETTEQRFRRRKSLFLFYWKKLFKIYIPLREDILYNAQIFLTNYASFDLFLHFTIKLNVA